MNNIDELLFSAAETEENKIIGQLLETMKQLDKLDTDEVKAGIDFLLESWGDSISSSYAKAKFCHDLALQNPPDSSALRISLQRALAKLNKTKFQRSAVIKATGIKETDTSLPETIERFHILGLLEEGIKVLNSRTKRFGTLAKLDDMTEELTLKWDGSGPQQSVLSLQAALSELIFFRPHPLFDQLSTDIKKVPAKKWQETVDEIFVSFPSPEKARRIAFILAIAQGTSPETFKAWWESAEKADQPKNAKRHPSAARTIHELHSLLEKYKGSNFNNEECLQMDSFYLKIKPNLSSKDAVMLIESTLLLAQHVDIENIKKICGEIKEKLPFWPAEEKIHYGDLSAWSKIPAKSLPPFAELTISVFSVEYMAELILQLPLRCWTSVVPVISHKVIFKRIMLEEEMTTDALMWLWRNRKGADANVLCKLHPRIITDALNLEIEDSSTQAIKLKEKLIGDQNFQTLILDNVQGTEMDLLRAVQTCNALRMDEKQSLLVKCSGISSEVKKYIEKGDGKKMFSSATREHAKKQQENQLALTSVHSFKKLNEELNDIITKQIPENSAAIAHAREYGDLKENAEFKAAKERQAFLQKRRGELELNIINTQPTDFTEVDPENTAVPGSTVTISYNNGDSEETFYLLGIWDSDPDKNHLSSASRLGEELKGKIVGEELDMPDGRQASIKDVKKLPDKVLKILAG